MENAQVPLPEDICAPAAGRMYQTTISEVLWTHISVLSFVFQRDLQWQSLLLYSLLISFILLLTLKYFSVTCAVLQYF
jgi:hypothetical protein